MGFWNSLSLESGVDIVLPKEDVDVILFSWDRDPTLARLIYVAEEGLVWDSVFEMFDLFDFDYWTYLPSRDESELPEPPPLDLIRPFGEYTVGVVQLDSRVRGD